MQIEVMDKTARGTKVIVATRSVKTVTMNIDKVNAQGTVFTFNKLGPNTNVERSVVLIKHVVESLLAEAGVS